MVELTCEKCGTPFEVYPYRAETAKFCSSSCSGSRPKPKRHKVLKLIDGKDHWHCPGCGEWKTERDFYKDKRTPNGLKSRCKSCHIKTNIESRDPEKHRISKLRSESKMRAKRAGVYLYGFEQSDWEKLKSIFGDKCCNCGTTKQPTWDHIIPISKGGPHHPGNMQRLCRPCNEKKQARTMDFRTDGQIKAVKSEWPEIEFEVKNIK